MSDDHSIHSHTQGLHHIKKKRVGKACDSCRIKKTKCDGKKPCNRCTLDNKICVFTEKKKTKEKKHPSGYVELLEARLDILTRLLEKLIELSRPHLQFIDDIITEEKLVDQEKTSPASSTPNSSSSDHHDDVEEQNSTGVVAPINKVVSYLIKEQGLLKNIPLEWEQGTEIAANFDPNRNLKLSSRLFAEHKGEAFIGSPVTSPQQMPTSNPFRRTSMFKEELESPSSDHYNELIFSQSVDEPYIKKEPNSAQFSKGTFSPPQQQLQQQQQMLNQFSLNTFRDISDIESDSSNKEDGLNSGSVSPPTSNYRSFSLFSDSNGEPILGKTSSLTSLTNKYENHSLSSPQTAINPVFNNSTTGPILTTLRRNSSSHSQKTLGSIQLQQKPRGSVHKPVRNHSRVSSFDKRMESTATAAATVAAVSGSVQPLQNTTPQNLPHLDNSQNNNYLRDNGMNNIGAGSVGGGLTFGAPSFTQPLSPSDDAIVYPTNQFTNRPATVSTFGGGLDVLVDNSLDPFFNI